MVDINIHRAAKSRFNIHAPGSRMWEGNGGFAVVAIRETGRRSPFWRERVRRRRKSSRGMKIGTRPFLPVTESNDVGVSSIKRPAKDPVSCCVLFLLFHCPEERETLFLLSSLSFLSFLRFFSRPRFVPVLLFSPARHERAHQFEQERSTILLFH